MHIALETSRNREEGEAFGVKRMRTNPHLLVTLWKVGSGGGGEAGHSSLLYQG